MSILKESAVALTRCSYVGNVGNVPTRSQSILSKLGKIRQELTVENVHVAEWSEGHLF